MTHTTFDPEFQAWRFYEDGTESGSTPYAAEDTDVTLDPTGDTKVHLRVMIQETGGADGATTDDWRLQYSKNSGSYAAVAGTDIGMDTASSLTDGSATTNRATNGISDGTGSFVAGEQDETGAAIVDHQLTANDFTEHVFAMELADADLANNDTLDFRITLNGGNPGMTNVVVPRITISKADIQSGDGASAGVATATGEGESTNEQDGSSAGVATATGDGTALWIVDGSSAGTSTATAVGQAVQSGDGSSAGTSTVAADGSSTASGAGSSDGVATVTGEGQATAEADGASAGVATVTGVGETAGGVVEGDGFAAGTSTATGEYLSTGAGRYQKKRRYILPDGKVLTDPTEAYLEAERQIRALAQEAPPETPKRKKGKARSRPPAASSLLADMTLPEIIERLPERQKRKIDLELVELAVRMHADKEEEEDIIAVILMAS